MSLVFENKVPIAYRVPFIAKVIDISSKLRIDPNWLMAIMDLETDGTFDPSITNSLGYTGLIQFGASAAAELGTTTAALRRMSAVEQLDYVYRYFARKQGQLTSLVDTYLHVFFPIAVGRGDDFLIESRGLSAAAIAKANKGFDTNKDGKIYVWEIKKALLARLPSEWLNDGSVALAVRAYRGYLTAGMILIAIGGTYLYYHVRKQHH